MTGKVRSFIINFSVLLAALAVFFACAEIFMRVFCPQPTYAVKYAPWGWEHIPNVSFIHGAERDREFVTRIRYNSHGLRDNRDFPFKKPDGTYRIEVYGDSYAEGVEVPYEKNFCKLLEDRLNADPLIPGARYEVMNFGVYAYDTTQEYLYFKYEGVKFNPDLVIVIYSMDDPQNLQRGFMRLDGGALKENLVRVTWKQELVRMVRGYIKSHSHFLAYIINRLAFMNPGSFVRDGAKIELVHDLPYRSGDEELRAKMSGPYWELTSAVFKEFNSAASGAGAKLLIVSTHIDPVKFAGQLQDRERFCAENGINFFATYDFGPEDCFKYHYRTDGHWNAAGHERIAGILYDKIKSGGLLGMG